MGLLTLRLRGEAPTKGICLDGADAAQLGVAGTVQAGAAIKGTRANAFKGRRQGDAGQAGAATKGTVANGCKGRRQGDAVQAGAALKGTAANGFKESRTPAFLLPCEHSAHKVRTFTVSGRR